MLNCYLSPSLDDSVPRYIRRTADDSSNHAAQQRHGFLRCVGLANICALPKAKQQGFTLLEMLVVIGLIGIVAMGSATLLIDDGDWKRQIETEARWDNIRKAIIGEPNLSLNGSPYVAGYVADMGRLPVSVFELIAQSDTTTTFDHDNNAGTAEITIDQPDWTEVELYKRTTATNCTTTPEDCYWLGGGWRGPYLYTAGSQQYRDGWANEDADADNDAFNFGWDITLTGAFPDVSDIAMHSLGSNNQVGGVEFSEDFPVDANQTMVSENEWTLSTLPITFNINFNKAIADPALPTAENPKTLPEVGGAAQDLELRVYRYMDNGDNIANFISQDDDTDDVEMVEADDIFNLLVDDTFAPAQTITPDTGLAVGRFAAVIWCTNNTPNDYSDDAVYDGNCDTTFDHSPVYFTLTHNTSQVTITWNLP